MKIPKRIEPTAPQPKEDPKIEIEQLGWFDIKQIINSNGGTGAIAEKLGVSSTTVWRWTKPGGKIPNPFEMACLNLIRAGLPLKGHHLPDQ